jgi:hypothetical protein
MEYTMYIYNKNNITKGYTNTQLIETTDKLQDWKHTATLDPVVFLNYLLTLNDIDIINEIKKLKNE